MKVLEAVASRLIKENIIVPGDRIVLGLSGGGDSVALLKSLLELRKEIPVSIRAVHINHCIRGRAADEDQSFVQKLCNKYQVELAVESYDIPDISRREGISTELAGRRARKEAFEKQLKSMGSGAKLLLAHHANDQEETIFMNFLRGSGMAGITGMKELQENRLEDGFTYLTVRPFLKLTHTELLEALKDVGWDWREDESNGESIYRRNRFRLEILPALKEMYPGLTEVLLRNAEIISDCDEYIRLQAQTFLEKYATREKGAISIDAVVLSQEHIALQREALRQAINSVGGLVDVSFAQLQEITGLLTAQSGKGVEVRGRNIRRSFDKLIISSGEVTWDKKLYLEKTVLSAEEVLKKIEEKSYKGYEKWFDCDKIARVEKSEIIIRPPEPDDYIIVDHAGHRKKLSVYLKQQKLDLALRDRIPVAVAGHLVLAVAGYRDSCGFEICGESKNILRIYMEE